MVPENLHKDSPENLPEDPSGELSDTNKDKLRRSSECVLKPVLYTIKRGATTLVDAKNSLGKWFNANRDKLRKLRREVIIWITTVACISLVAVVTSFIMEKQQAKKTEKLTVVKIAERTEDISEVTPALGEGKAKSPQISKKIQRKPDLFKKSPLTIVLAIAFVVGVTLSCLFGLRYQWLRESQDMITELNDEKTALSEEVKTKEEEYSCIFRKHEYIQMEFQKQKGEISRLVSERNSLQEGICQLQEKARSFDELVAKNKSLEGQLPEKDKLLQDERNQRQQLEDKLLQSEKDLEEAMWPSLDLRPLAEKGVLLKLEPKGPVVTLKRIATEWVSFESDRKLDIPSPCNMTLIFFGSFSSMTARGSLIWQKKIPGSSEYNVSFKFLSLKQSQSGRINEYINKTRKALRTG